ncbi:protein FAM227B [Meriones unguiculatus]|uniref:protein FAM227B n=1 Tax=Meriones unguiculatus TaxID=10047 RepID=UPI00293F6667|nr:protein FAM227B [Meriones unguiculatus]
MASKTRQTSLDVHVYSTMTGQGKSQLMQKPVLKKCKEPPRSFEEFLKCQNWDYWPRNVFLKNISSREDAMKKLEEESSFTSIFTHLWTNVPQVFETLGTMELRLKECELLLQRHSSKLFDCDKMISKKSSCAKLDQYKAFLKEHDKQKKIVLSDEMETEKNIEGCNFSGFKQNELTQLPRHLDAKQIYLFVLRTRNLEENLFKIWRNYILSDCSIALLHDSFWWWFLHKFKPDKRDQDCLFDRISENYVTLFLRIPIKRKDAFFQMYPDYLAQAIYAAFQESFPESSSLFNDEFKEDLGNTIYLWLSGLKPRSGFWNQWRLKDLCTTTIHGSRRPPSKLVKSRTSANQEHIVSTIDFNMENILKNPKSYGTSVHKDESTTSKATTKSHYMSFGPEFHRVLFNFGGQSPLILYYLKMHEIGGISIPHKKNGSKFTKILQEPPPAPTYYEVIKEAKKNFAMNKRDLKRTKQTIREEVRVLKERQERIDRELDRLQAKSSRNIQEVKNDFENFLHKMRVEDKFEKYKGSTKLPALPQLLSISSSSTSTTVELEDFNHVAEEGKLEESQQ